MEHCYNLLHLNATFLFGLYNNNELTFKKLLAVANDSQLKTVIGILHFIAVGEIPSQISKDKNVTVQYGNYLKKEFQSCSKIRVLLNSERIIKLKKVTKLGHLFHNLFFYLFNVKRQLEKPI